MAFFELPTTEERKLQKPHISQHDNPCNGFRFIVRFASHCPDTRMRVFLIFSQSCFADKGMAFGSVQVKALSSVVKGQKVSFIAVRQSQLF